MMSHVAALGLGFFILAAAFFIRDRLNDINVTLQQILACLKEKP